jgi:hypothetical protein
MEEEGAADDGGYDAERERGGRHGHAGNQVGENQKGGAAEGGSGDEHAVPGTIN